MRGSSLTPPERILRYCCVLTLLLASVATVAAWDIAAVIGFALAIPGTVLSLILEWLTARHRRKELEAFYPEADDFLAQLFRDQPP